MRKVKTVALGFLYFNGQGVAEDKALAEKMFQSVVDRGYAEGYLGLASAMYDIGDIYCLGYGVEQDYAKALEWCEKAAALGDSDAAVDAENIRTWIEG